MANSRSVSVPILIFHCEVSEKSHIFESFFIKLYVRSTYFGTGTFSIQKSLFHTVADSISESSDSIFHELRCQASRAGTESKQKQTVLEGLSVAHAAPN